MNEEEKQISVVRAYHSEDMYVHGQKVRPKIDDESNIL
jgi:hypothetical protein